PLRTRLKKPLASVRAAASPVGVDWAVLARPISLITLLLIWSTRRGLPGTVSVCQCSTMLWYAATLGRLMPNEAAPLPLVTVNHHAEIRSVPTCTERGSAGSNGA